MGTPGLLGRQENKAIYIEHRQARQSRVLAPVVAWVSVLLASDLDFIASQLIGVHFPPWASLARAAVLVVVAMTTWRSGRLPHLHRFVFALAAMLVGDWLLSQIEPNLYWLQGAARAQRMFARVFLTLIPGTAMALSLAGSGISRHDLFLTSGDWSAPTSLPFLRGRRWSIVAPLLLTVVSATLIVQLWIVSHGSRHFRADVLLLGLPAAVLFAALNASSEEFRFRCVLLAHGVRSIGVTHAVAATSVLFGLAHFGGHPSGISGVLMAGFFAWVVARSMVDTRGWGWAWLLHFVQDVIIFLMVLMTGV